MACSCGDEMEEGGADGGRKQMERTIEVLFNRSGV